MCTAITFKTKQHYFGRNLDLEYHYDEKITITPRNFPIKFRNEEAIKSHPAIIGMATICDNYPLYYDAMNELGLAIAGLNFPGNACFLPQKEAYYNIASFEFILWILSKCKNVEDAINLLKSTNITDEAFSDDFFPTPLHFMIADKKRSITVEPLFSGLKIYENEIGVLTNNPTFDMQLFNLNNYINLSNATPKQTFSKAFKGTIYSSGMGGLGLPGDLSSMSRFVRAAFTKQNSECLEDENSSITQFFHILSSVAFTRGTVKVNNSPEITIYSSCLNQDRGIYYYTTYENRQISSINLYSTDLSGANLVTFTPISKQSIKKQN